MDVAGGSSVSSEAQLHEWKEIQQELKKKLITHDNDFTSTEGFKYVGGVDMSFSKEDPSFACACLVVMDMASMRIVYHDYSILNLQIPYIPGFLAFREAPVFSQLLDKLKKSHTSLFPQVLMVDGNGLLHPQGFGLACHIGVLANIPTIGIGKNLHHVDGLTWSGLRQLLETKEMRSECVIPLKGDSGYIWGAALRSTLGSSKPIFVSVGHRISLESAIKIVKMTCSYRVPEPIRQADLRSRVYIQEYQKGKFERCNDLIQACDADQSPATKI